MSRLAARKFSTGRSWALRCRTSRYHLRNNRPWSTSCLISPRDRASELYVRSEYAGLAVMLPSPGEGKRESSPLLLIHFEMRVGSAQFRHRHPGGIGARDQIADYVISLDRGARPDVAEHRGVHWRALGREHAARSF